MTGAQAQRPAPVFPPLAAYYRRDGDLFEVIGTYGKADQRVHLVNVQTETPYHTDRLSLPDEGFTRVEATGRAA